MWDGSASGAARRPIARRKRASRSSPSVTRRPGSLRQSRCRARARFLGCLLGLHPEPAHASLAVETRMTPGHTESAGPAIRGKRGRSAGHAGRGDGRRHEPGDGPWTTTAPRIASGCEAPDASVVALCRYPSHEIEVTAADFHDRQRGDSRGRCDVMADASIGEKLPFSRHNGPLVADNAWTPVHVMTAVRAHAQNQIVRPARPCACDAIMCVEDRGTSLTDGGTRQRKGQCPDYSTSPRADEDGARAAAGWFRMYTLSRTRYRPFHGLRRARIRDVGTSLGCTPHGRGETMAPSASDVEDAERRPGP
jgi:hypothetical protein